MLLCKFCKRNYAIQSEPNSTNYCSLIKLNKHSVLGIRTVDLIGIAAAQSIKYIIPMHIQNTQQKQSRNHKQRKAFQYRTQSQLSDNRTRTHIQKLKRVSKKRNCGHCREELNTN